MNILLVSATDFETAPLLTAFQPAGQNSKNFRQFQFCNHSVDVLVTGVGIPFTIYHLTSLLAKKSYHLVLNAGIAGSFKKKTLTGTVVNVCRDRFADIGIEDRGNFKSIFEINLGDKNLYPFTDGALINKSNTVNEAVTKLPEVSAVTVNKVSGINETIKSLVETYHPDIETMEGAAFCYVCMMEKLPYFQIRSVSNFIEERNTGKWDIRLAVENLNMTLLEIMKGF